jgi:preprotein translocase subunit SecE
MKKHTKKRGKRGIRKKTKSESGRQIISRSDSGSNGEEKEKRKRIVQAVSKSEHEKRRGDKASVIRYVNVAIQFLRECKIELKKVKWPTRKELLASTAMVVSLVLAMAFFLGLIDFVLVKIIKTILD